MEDILVEAIESELKGVDIGKYISALFRAEDAFRKELAEYEKHKKQGEGDMTSMIGSLVSGAFFKRLPLKYRVALKLPWQYAVDTLSGFLKELGDGSAEDVLTSLAKVYIDNLTDSTE